MEAAAIRAPQVEDRERPTLTIQRVNQWLRPERRELERREIGRDARGRRELALVGRHVAAGGRGDKVSWIVSS